MNIVMGFRVQCPLSTYSCTKDGILELGLERKNTIRLRVDNSFVPTLGSVETKTHRYITRNLAVTTNSLNAEMSQFECLMTCNIAPNQHKSSTTAT